MRTFNEQLIEWADRQENRRSKRLEEKDQEEDKEEELGEAVNHPQEKDPSL